VDGLGVDALQRGGGDSCEHEPGADRSTKPRFRRDVDE
jgi:hypothetical protein